MDVKLNELDEKLAREVEKLNELDNHALDMQVHLKRLYLSINESSKTDSNFHWDISDKNINHVILNDEVLEFFKLIKVSKDQDALGVFWEDIRMSILAEEIISLIHEVNNDALDDRLRPFFDGITRLSIDENDFLTDDTLLTNIYFKEIKTFVEFTLLKSKSGASSLLRRFSGFNLVKSGTGNKGGYTVYYNYHEAMQLFFELLKDNGNKVFDDPKKSLYFLDKYTNYLDIFLWGMFLEKENDKIPDKNILGILSIKAPLSKSHFLNETNSFLLEWEYIVEIYTLLFEEAKRTFYKIIYMQDSFIKKKNETNMNFKIRTYNNLQSKFKDFPYYDNLVKELIRNTNDNEKLEGILGQTVQEITELNRMKRLKKAYTMLYENNRKQKSR